MSRPTGRRNAFDVLMAAARTNPWDTAILPGDDTENSEEAKTKERNYGLSPVSNCPFLIRVRVYYKTKKRRGAYICGVELDYTNAQGFPWDGTSVTCGKVAGAKKSESVGFSKFEHIIGVEFEGSAGNGVASLTLYTSDPGGRNISFYASGDDIDTLDDVGDYRGLYEGDVDGKELRPERPQYCNKMTFTCKRGNRVTGMKFKRRTIVRIDQEPIPKGLNELWWTKSMEYDPPSRPLKRARKSAPEEARCDDEDGMDSAESYGENEDEIDKYTTLSDPEDADWIQREYRDGEHVSFFRPDGTTESKDVDWCLCNDFFQIEAGLWSGPWFYRKYPKAEALHTERMKRMERIRRLCRDITPGECDSEDYFGY